MQSGGGDECPSLGHLAGHGREREGDIFGGGGEMEVCGSWNFGKDWDFWKMEKLVACGGRKERNKGKGKMEKKL